MKKGISIVICTYNGKAYIGETLNHIALQNRDRFNIELIVVDNNSNDGTYDYVLQKWYELRQPFDMKLLKESKIGKFNASSLGFSVAQYDYILICDDDNFLYPDYCLKAFNILEQYNEVGIAGGKGIPEFEDTEPEWFKKYETVFACGRQYNVSGIIDDSSVNLWGAGMIFRKKIWDDIQKMDKLFFLSAHRTKKDNSGGDDTELCEIAKMMGYKLYYDDNMVFKHFMPKKRMKIDFLKRRFKGLGKSRLYLRAYRYCYLNDELPDKNLKIPFWKDVLTYRNRELLNYYPRIWFVKQTYKNLDFILKYQALKGEIAEIKRLKDNYIYIYKDIFYLKEKINNFAIR
ncbi:MAG TPA: glycosyltransferase [Bacteroidales bacterium]|nr:glycosyltransferase [Bacteroidales bacterium]